MMTLKSPEFLRRYVRMHHDVVSHAEACRRLGGMDESTVFGWLRQSKAAAERKEDPSEWLIEIDGEENYFHTFCARSFSDCYQAGVANVFVRFRDGVTTTLTYQGHVCYKLNPDYLDEGMRDLLGLGEGDKYLRDANGNMIPETIVQPMSTDLTIALMAAHQPKVYGKKSTVDVNQRLSGGVVVMGGPRQPTQIAAPLPVLEVIEDAEDKPALAVTDTPPDQPAEAIDDEEPETPDPGPRIAEKTPPEYVGKPNPLVDPQRSAALAEQFLSKLPTDNSAVRAALLKGKA